VFKFQKELPLKNLIKNRMAGIKDKIKNKRISKSEKIKLFFAFPTIINASPKYINPAFKKIK